MAHLTAKKAYSDLNERLNRFPQGAPSSKSLFQILQILFSEKEAALIALLPIKPFTVTKASQIWQKSERETQKILDSLAGRALLIDMENNGKTEYVLPPPMAGFIEFSLMRTRGDINQKLLAELYYQYMNVEEDFIKNLFTLGDTQLGRIFVQEPVLSNNQSLHVMDYERASNVIQTASHIGISICYCRHKMAHVGKACDAPMDICMTFNTTGASLIRNGYARAVGRSECMELLHKSYEENLVQFGENNREGINFICNCCSCCCEAMIAARKFGFLNPVHTSNYVLQSTINRCKGCGKCAKVCPVACLKLESADDPANPKRKKIKIDTNICLGCGVCVRNCKNKAISLKTRQNRVLTPLNTTHRTIVMAIERGVFQHLIFDNRVLWSHRMLAAVLGVILRLPVIKQVMASQQVKSRFMEAMVRKFDP